MNRDCNQAWSNTVTAINIGRNFPENVFVGAWYAYRFFDSDWIFDPMFVKQVQMLLIADASTCACLANLDRVTQSETTRAAYLITVDSKPVEYKAVLKGDDVDTGWIHQFDRFGCASDSGRWCIYCERSNEIAVFAVRAATDWTLYKEVMRQLRAEPIEAALQEPLAYGFASFVLPNAWSTELRRSYCDS